MINRYEKVDEETFVIFVFDAKKKQHEVYVDAEDIDKIHKTFLEIRIYMQDGKPISNAVTEADKTPVRLHRFIANAKHKEDVKLRDGNPLNLRKKNLLRMVRGTGSFPKFVEEQKEMNQSPPPQARHDSNLEINFSLLQGTLLIKKGSSSVELDEQQVSELKRSLAKMNI